MQTTTTTRAAIYLRQSIDKTGEELGIDRQRKDCLALCKARGWKVVGQYPDNDRSATNGKLREHYQRMLADIRAGKVDVVVAQHQDRLHRNVMELLLFTEVAIEHNLKLATTSGDIDLTTDDGEFMATLGAALARKEVRRKGARQRKANEQMAENDGRPWWPARPFGYDADRDRETGRWWTIRKDPITKKVLAVNPIRKHPVEAKLVKEAYKQFNAGATLWSIAERWNEKGVTTPLGNRWRASQVRHVLLASRNAGLREYDGKIVGKGTWPAIVTEDVWRQACRTLADPKRKSGNAPPGRKYLLSGIVRCGRCGHTLTSLMTQLGRHNYICHGGCRKLSRNGPKLDELIIEAVVRRLSRPDAVTLLRPAVPEVDAEELREERAALHDRLKQLGRDFANARPEFRNAALQEVNDRLDAIDAALIDPGKAAIFEDVIGAKDVRKAFDSLDLGRRRAIVDALLTIRVLPVGKGNGPVFDPDAIEVELKA